MNGGETRIAGVRTICLLLAAAALVAAMSTLRIGAQQRPAQFHVEPLTDATGQRGVGLALRKLTTVGTFMHTTAHPDDENIGVMRRKQYEH